jgi:hypothetical protein
MRRTRVSSPASSKIASANSAAVGVYRLFAFWAPTLPALAALVLLPRAGSRLQQLRAEPAVP